MSQLQKDSAIEIVTACLKEVMTQTGATAPGEVTPETVIVGKDAVLDSLGVVSLIVEIEQAIDSKYNLQVTLANDKAMSAKNSPFRTVGVLAEHVVEVAAGSHA